MSKFFVNGIQHNFDDEMLLIRVLRDELKLLSVKDGCSEGACGTCTVLIDGAPQKCCVRKVKLVDGKNIVTVEGLSDREKDVFTYAFGKAGAVQCGFCIPGMIICAKALIDSNSNPTRIEAAYAIRNNFCRCTGYKKIIDGIILAAKMLRENIEIPTESDTLKIGDNPIRCDVPDKILGKAKYADDIYFDDMIYCSAIRSKYPRAKLLSIDYEEAKKVKGFVGVITAEDINGKIIKGHNITGHLTKDWSTIIPVGEETHYLGDAVCLVYCETKDSLDKAKSLIKVEYEELMPMCNVYDAMKDGADVIHKELNLTNNILVEKHIKRGNVDEAINNAKYKVTKKYFTPFTEHAFLEPECAVAIPLQDGGVMLYTSDQGTYDTRRECSNVLGIDEDKVIVENAYVGGGFGGKEDMTVQPYAALGAYIFKRPCKAKLSRQESMQVHPKRHPMDIEMTTACDENGKIVGMKAKVIADTGAYASLGGPVLERACTHAVGPYNYQNSEIQGIAVYTNNPPSGAFRGFGVTQTCFAMEQNLNLLADMVGIDYFEIRMRNAIHPGEILPNGQIADDSTGLVETLEAVKEDYYNSGKNVGIACAFKNAGVGVGLPDIGRCRLLVKNGVLEIHCGASENGQGIGSVLMQVVCGETGLKKNQVMWHNANTKTDPDSGTTSGSRQTLVSGEAAIRACKEFLKDYNGDINVLEGKEYFGEYFEPTDKLGAEVEFPKSHIAYGYATQVCILDDDGLVKKLIGAHEVGKAVNKVAVEGQIEGGMTMSLGFALTENLKVENGKVNAKYGTYGLFRADKMPELDARVIEKAGIKGANGAIGCGEITAIPTAPAIALAYYRKDGEFRNTLPIKNTPYLKS